MHGVIDGYSRLVVFLRCSSNDRAATVVNLFLSATTYFYWPLRVRTEKGEENSEVAGLMAEKRGEGRGSILVVRSTTKGWRGCGEIFAKWSRSISDSSYIS